MHDLNNKHSMLTRNEVLNLAQRYFDATTTEEEEELLKQYVTTIYINDPAFEDVIATLSFTSYKPLKQATLTTNNNGKGFGLTVRHRWHRAFNIGIAAMLCITIGISGAIWNYQYNNQCIAYIDGKKTTDTKVVMKAMKASINDINQPTDEPTVETQLNDIFNTIDE